MRRGTVLVHHSPLTSHPDGEPRLGSTVARVHRKRRPSLLDSRRWLRSGAVVLAAAALAVTACNGPSSTPSVSLPSATIPEATPSSTANASLPSATQGAGPSSTANASLPTPTAPEAATPSCTTARLQISVVHTAVAAGTVGGYLSFVNMSKEPCHLQGWPTIIGETAGTTTVSRQVRSVLTFPDVTGVPTVTLDPGAAAVAAFAGGDNPAGSASSCPPPYRSIQVTPPGNTQPVSLSAWIPYDNAYLPSCAGIDVTMVVPEADLPFLEPTASYDVDNNYPLAASVYEKASSSTPHLVGHPTNIVIEHWVAVSGYRSSGSQTYYADSVHGTTFWTWSGKVPAFGTIASGQTGISYMMDTIPYGYIG